MSTVTILKRLPVSLVAGLLIGVMWTCTRKPSLELSCSDRQDKRETPIFRRQLYVGVMTAKSQLHTRALAVNQTWAQYASRLDFYTAIHPENHTTRLPPENLPLIKLPNVSDDYPPLKKYFRMLQYIANHFVEEYNWFMRADDDCYVRIPELMKFLGQLDPSQLLYIGASGTGRQEDLKTIKFFTHELFCLGGSGTVFSRALLKELRSHLEHCLNESTSLHDDAEVGKCISRQIGIQCTSSNQVHNSIMIFH